MGNSTVIKLMNRYAKFEIVPIQITVYDVKMSKLFQVEVTSGDRVFSRVEKRFEIDLPVRAVTKVNGDFISAHVFGVQYAYRFAHMLLLQVFTILIIANSP